MIDPDPIDELTEAEAIEQELEEAKKRLLHYEVENHCLRVALRNIQRVIDESFGSLLEIKNLEK